MTYSQYATWRNSSPPAGAYSSDGDAGDTGDSAGGAGDDVPPDKRAK